MDPEERKGLGEGREENCFWDVKYERRGEEKAGRGRGKKKRWKRRWGEEVVLTSRSFRPLRQDSGEI